MSTRIEDAKRELEEPINKEFPRLEEGLRRLEDDKFDDLAILLIKEVSAQNINPGWLVGMIKGGVSIEDILKHAEEANAKQKRINQLITNCYKLQDLCRK